MKKLAYPILLLLIAAACNRSPKDDGTSPAPLFPQPKSVDAKPEGGYIVNPVSGDTIQPIILESGDTLITGVPIPAMGKVIHPDSVTQPKVVPYIPSSSTYNAHPNRHKIPENLTKISVNKDSLTTIPISLPHLAVAGIDTTHYLINSTGDTVKTGIPIPAKGKTVPTIQPQPTPALPPAFKDAAIANLQYLDVDQGMNSSYVLSILEDKSGNLWFGTYGGGVSKYDGKSFTHYTEKQGLSNNRVRAILEDKSGNLWFGTDGGGVSKYDGKTFTHYTEKEGLSNNYVWAILEDKSVPIGVGIWFGTSGGGVSKYDGKTFKHYTEKEGLSNNRVQSILEDNSDSHRNGNLYIATEKGLNVIALDIGTQSQILPDRQSGVKETTKVSKNPQISIHTFEKGDGLKALDFFANSAFIDSKNRAWWGGGKGLEMLDLNKFSIAQIPPAIYLKQLDINEQFIDYRNITDSLGNEITFNGVQKFENYPLNLKLSYDKNHLTFHFVAIDWSAPHKIQYSYRMLGLNDNWSNPSKEAKAEYRNLSYGTYAFQIRAIGESGEWSEPFEYTFTINPPWWHTWWFRSLCVLLALILILILIKWRTAALIKRQKELEKTVEERTEELVQKNIVVEQQKHLVEEKHKEITDSINYAERIQRSFLASREMLDANLGVTSSVPQQRDVSRSEPGYFVFFQPKDVVSGDFYWAGKLTNGNFAIVNADSTGHGVPGAIMSILNISSIEKAVDKGLVQPNEIFNDTRKTIIERLKKDGSPEGGKDGMDASLISINPDKTKMTYVAAQNPIWIIRNEELIEIKPEKMPVGKHENDKEPFIGGEVDLQKGDLIYTITDGFQDQFGGEKGKKFMVKKMREYLISISNLSMKEQHQKLNDVFTNWKGEHEQVDDVCIIGVRV